MRWFGTYLRPDPQFYSDLANELYYASSPFETGWAIYITIQLFLAFLCFLIFALLGVFGSIARMLAASGVLLGLSLYSFVKAYRGLVKSRVRIVPISFLRGETGFVGGRLKVHATGKAARAVGVLFLIAGAASAVGAISFGYSLIISLIE